MRATSPSVTTRGTTGVDVAAARVGEDGVGAREAGELLEVLDRREDELDLVARWRRRARRRGANQPQSTHSSPSTRGSWPAGAGARKKCVSKRILTSGGVIQRENFTSASGSSSAIAASSCSSRTAAIRWAASPSPSVVSTAPPGKTHDAAHEPRLRRAPHEQDLERLGATAQQDHRRGLARDGLLAVEREFLAQSPDGRSPRREGTLTPMTETTTVQLWICESCGFIYDPAEGDPDGGIPPGTPFDDIPDTWFCPVCGARKKDFVPYED